MIPVMRESPKQTQHHSIATTLLGFVLGMFVMYCYMQPNDSERSPMPQKSFKLVFDESALENVRSPADVFQCIARVPIPKPIREPAPLQYGTMMLRNDLLRL